MTSLEFATGIGSDEAETTLYSHGCPSGIKGAGKMKGTAYGSCSLELECCQIKDVRFRGSERMYATYSTQFNPLPTNDAYIRYELP